MNNIDYIYPNGTHALNGISLNIQKGEFLAIMGQNGAGKTTLIRLLNGLLRPSKGDIFFEGENIKYKTIASLSQKIGIIFQNPMHQLFSNTVEDEILFSLKSLGLEKHKLKSQADSILKRFKFDNYRNRSPLNLSGGEAKRLAIASILCRDPEVIVFDDNGHPTHWDANIYDRDGIFTVTAYPLYFVEHSRNGPMVTGEWKGNYQEWITCLEIEGVQS